MDYRCDKAKVGYAGQEYEIQATDTEGHAVVIGWTNELDCKELLASLATNPSWREPHLVMLSEQQICVKSLDSDICPHCRNKKKRGQSFCQTDYFALPGNLRNALYKHVGSGYEQTFEAAKDFLKHEAHK